MRNLAFFQNAGSSRPMQQCIIVQLLGGLGNQMFQYALGRALSLRRGAQLLVDTSLLLDTAPGRHLVARGYDLDIFKLQVPFATRANVARYHSHGASTPGKILFHLRRRLLGNQICSERYFTYDPDVLDLDPPLYLAGT